MKYNKIRELIKKKDHRNQYCYVFIYIYIYIYI